MDSAERSHIPTGAKVRLACDREDCFVGDIAITSKGGQPRGAPRCPGCAHGLRPLGEIEPPYVDDE